MTIRDNIAIIPARGGSVRMPRKNVATFMGKPLIHWTVRAALNSESVDRAIVTTDDQAIADAAVAAGAECPFLRPAHLSTSDATTLDVVQHLLDTLKIAPTADFVVMQPTSPLRFADDVDAARALMTSRGAPAVVSVSQFEKPWPVMRNCALDGTLINVPIPAGGTPQYQLNGAIYWSGSKILRETGSFTPVGCLAHVMSAEASVDIDTPLDFIIAETIARTMPERFA